MPVSPPRPKPPPLNALRAFEAAARLGGFKKAADELCVTPGAISQQVKLLENWAGAPLFERRSQGVVLTAIGATVAGPFSAAFDTLGTAARILRSEARQNTVSVAALPSVAQLWLSPRLPAIRTEFPSHTLSITALEEPPNLRRDLYDISIFLEPPSGRPSELILAPDLIFPVCAPDIARRLKKPGDLMNETWLHDALWPDDWALWANGAAPELPTPQVGPRFSLYSLAVEEAKNGAGVLIGHEILIASHLESGALVAPFTQKIASGKSLVLECSDGTRRSKLLQEIVMRLAET